MKRVCPAMHQLPSRVPWTSTFTLVPISPWKQRFLWYLFRLRDNLIGQFYLGIIKLFSCKLRKWSSTCVPCKCAILFFTPPWRHLTWFYLDMEINHCKMQKINLDSLKFVWFIFHWQTKLTFCALTRRNETRKHVLQLNLNWWSRLSRQFQSECNTFWRTNTTQAKRHKLLINTTEFGQK